MLTVAIFLVILLSIINKKDKHLSTILLILLFFAIVFVEKMADLEGYEKLYYNPDLDVRDIEPAFKALTDFFNALQVPFIVFRMFFFIVYISTLNYIAKHLTPYISFFWAIFALSLFCMHVVWIRFSLGTLFVYIALYILFSGKYTGLKKYIFAGSLMLIATQFHGGTVVFLPLLFLDLISERSVYIALIAIFIVFNGLSYTSLMDYLALFMVEEKLTYLDTAFSHGDSTSVFYQSIASILCFIGAFFLLFVEKRNLKKYNNDKEVQALIKKVEFAQKINAYSLSVVLLVNIFDAFVRFYYYMFPFYLIVLSYNFKYSKQKWLYSASILAYAIGLLVVFVLVDEPSRVGGWFALYHF